jgi:transcription elongation GreA/GreB family factor
MRSLAEVVQPSLAQPKTKKGSHDINLVWTTEAGYLKTQERARQLGTVEIVENAKEIEAARALGDLRENSEYKFALEKRSRLQSELKALSEQLGRARLITRNDIAIEEVGIGSIVELEDSKGNSITYTVLGPWDADIDANILSFQSKFAQAMTGVAAGDRFQFRDEEYKVVSVKSYLDK